MKKNLFVAVLLGVAALSTASMLKAQAQQVNPSWSDIEQKVDQRTSQVKNVKAYFRLDTFTNAEARSHAKLEAIQAEEQKIKPLPNDSNTSMGFYWIADKSRWKCERVTFYPEVVDDYDLSSFDGEKYTIYNSYKQIATISSTGDKAAPVMFQSIGGNEFFSLYNLDYYDAIAKEKKFSINFAMNEKVGNFDCIKFTGSDGIYDVSLWLCPNHQYTVVKISQGWKDKTGNGVRSLLTVTQTEESQGVIIPNHVEKSLFTLDKGNLKWLQTQKFALDSMSINSKLTDGDFQNVLRVGTPTINELESPGSVDIVGGNPNEFIEQVKEGAINPLLPPQ